MSEADEIVKLAPEFLRNVYYIKINQNTPIVNLHQVAEHMDQHTLGTTDSNYVDKLSRVGQYLEGRGFLEGKDGSKTQGPSMFTITEKGIDEVEGRNQPQEPSVSNVFNVSGNFYQPVIGTNNTNTFSGNFDFSTVEERIETDGGDDREELHRLVAEVRKLLENGETLDKGFLARWNGKLKEYGWLSSAVAGWLLNFSTQDL